MKIMSQFIISLTVFLSSNAFATDDMANQTATKSVKPTAAYTAAMEEIKTSLGMVPTMLKLYPKEALPAVWEEMKSVEMNPNAMIPDKYKELIGLAVAAQVPCKYCIYMHSKFAALYGATEREINEAVAVASMVRKWSTFAYGSNMDMDKFKKDVDLLVKNTKAQMQKSTPAPVAMEAANMTTADMAIKDVQNMYGFVPNFISEYYKPALPGAWAGLRDFHMSPNTAIPSKFKSMIGLAVGAQMPCTYCVYIDSEFAKLNGATSDELNEAILMSASVRHWSTFLNGIAMDEAKFRREVDQMVAIAKKKMGNIKTDRQATNH